MRREDGYIACRLKATTDGIQSRELDRQLLTASQATKKVRSQDAMKTTKPQGYLCGPSASQHNLKFAATTYYISSALCLSHVGHTLPRVALTRAASLPQAHQL